jgi:hypothetical protein
MDDKNELNGFVCRGVALYPQDDPSLRVKKAI